MNGKIKHVGYIGTRKQIHANLYLAALNIRQSTHSSQDIKGGLLSQCDGYNLPGERNRHVAFLPEKEGCGRYSCATCIHRKPGLSTNFSILFEVTESVSRLASCSMRKQL